MAGWTGLEPAAFRVTGGRYNQLNYHPVLFKQEQSVYLPCFNFSNEFSKPAKSMKQLQNETKELSSVFSNSEDFFANSIGSAASLEIESAGKS